MCAEAGNHHLYQIDEAQDDEAQMYTSRSYELILEAQRQLGPEFADEDNKSFQFRPTELRHLNLVDEVQSLAPVLSAVAHNRRDEHRLLVSCGGRSSSSFRVLRHGLEVGERAISMLPSVATGVWSIKKRCDSSHDDYIVVSFTNATLVLGVGETIDEIVDSGFLGTKTTLACSQLGDDSLVQVHPDGIRHIHADKRVSEWRTPFKRQIVKCALNQRQVAIALSNNEILYFEMDTTGQLNEYNERREFKSSITSMALCDIVPGELRSQFLAVGFEQKVSIISLDLNDCMTEVTRQTFTSIPETITMAELGGNHDLNRAAQLYLNVGLQSGELVRTRLDQVSGDLSEPIRRYLGTKAINLFNIRVRDKTALLACTNKTWLIHSHQNRCQILPLSYEPFDYASSFSSPQVPEGVVAITGSTLRLLSLDRLGDVYNQQIHAFPASVRRFVVHEPSGNVVVMTTDRLPLLIGTEGTDRWRSAIHLLNPDSGRILKEFPFESNKAALSLAIASFGTTDYTIHVGVARNYVMKTNTAQESEIQTFSITIKGDDMEFLHKTPCEAPARAMCAFQDRLLVGVGRILRMYDLGKRKLLRKCESKQVANLVATITCSRTNNQRIFVGDIQESFTLMKYRRDENVLSVFADDTYPRYLVSSGVYDDDTVLGGDKFGNLCVLQVTEDTNDDLDDDPTGTRSLWDRGWLGGASQKVDTVAMFHIGEIVTAIQRTSLSLGRAECVLYTTLSGAIGALIPFEHKEEFEFFQTLEMHLRAEEPPYCGRDHLAYRSSYYPIKNVIDGDLCEQFMSLDPAIQQKIADELDRPPGEICMIVDQMVEKIM